MFLDKLGLSDLANQIKSMFQETDVTIPGTANATHSITELHVYRFRNIVHIYGYYTCVYVPSDSNYHDLITDSRIPCPLNGLSYLPATQAGELVVGEGKLMIKGGTKGAGQRFHDTYVCV